jgi:hypothetical protein
VERQLSDLFAIQQFAYCFVISGAFLWRLIEYYYEYQRIYVLVASVVKGGPTIGRLHDEAARLYVWQKTR